METPAIKLNWISRSGKQFLKFIFYGHFSTDQLVHAIASWKNEISRKLALGKKAHIICDCLEMTGFDPEAKKEWQQILKEESQRIEDIWIISKNPTIILAANTMAIFSQFRIKAVYSESEIS